MAPAPRRSERLVAEIGARRGPFDLGFVKIGAYGRGQAWTDIHMPPEQSAQAAREVGARRPFQQGIELVTPLPQVDWRASGLSTPASGLSQVFKTGGTQRLHSPVPLYRRPTMTPLDHPPARGRRAVLQSGVLAGASLLASACGTTRTMSQPALEQPGADIARGYIVCTKPASGSFGPFAERLRQDPAWRFAELATGHNATVTAPQALADVLLKWAA